MFYFADENPAETLWKDIFEGHIGIMTNDLPSTGPPNSASFIDKGCVLKFKSMYENFVVGIHE